MNIFVLDENPYKAASYHCDKHVVKMILETAQMLSTAHHVLDPNNPGNAELYRATHHNHPCNIWVRETSGNYLWTSCLFDALLNEYTYRYGKIHASDRFATKLSKLPPAIRLANATPFAQAMPDDCKHESAVEAYRKYYMNYKAGIAKWNYSAAPDWFQPWQTEA